MGDQRKITVHIDSDLLAKARETTGEGVTETVRRGLRLLAAQRAFEEFRALRGQVKLELDLDELREDREL